jgi:signal peptidase I
MENGFIVLNEDEVLDEMPDDNGAEPQKFIAKEIFDWIDTIVIALIAVVLIFTFFFRIATIVGPSMQNTLYSGERVMISGFQYEPKFGDIVVISRNTENSIGNVTNGREPIIKRIIATEGQWVDIDFKKGIVYVGPDPANLKPLDEPYTKTLTTRKWDIDFPVYVKDNCVFVLGDNRNDSLDSRSSSIGQEGLIDKRYILGKAIYRIWPFDTFGGL